MNGDPQLPHWLEWIRALWPVFVALLPIIAIGGFAWLKTQFQLRSEAAADRSEAAAGRAAIAKRVDTIEGRLADYDRRVSLVENDCKAEPSKYDLNQAITVIAGRLSAVESSLRGLEQVTRTQNDYLHTLIDKGLAGGGR